MRPGVADEVTRQGDAGRCQMPEASFQRVADDVRRLGPETSQLPVEPGQEDVDMESVSLANRWTVFGVPCSCPEGATGESPGWNPGDHATQRAPCPEGAHGTG